MTWKDHVHELRDELTKHEFVEVSTNRYEMFGDSVTIVDAGGFEVRVYSERRLVTAEVGRSGGSEPRYSLHYVVRLIGAEQDEELLDSGSKDVIPNLLDVVSRNAAAIREAFSDCRFDRSRETLEAIKDEWNRKSGGTT